MKYAIPYDQGQVHGHLGSTEAFKFYDVNGKEIVSSVVVDAPAGGRDALFNFLVESGVDVLVGGGLCSTAVSLLGELGVTAYGGASGEVDAALEAFFNNEIEFSVGGPCGHDH